MQPILQENLENLIVDAIQEKKGTAISVIDLKGVERAICEKLIICQGSSTTHTEAVANFVEHQVKTKSQNRLLTANGYENCLWIVLDYFDVVVHVFVGQQRELIRLEDLWLDAQITHINEPAAAVQKS